MPRLIELSIYGEPQASLNEAIGIIVGNTPKSKTKPDQEPYLCGEKGYSVHFATYKSVCHFIAALEKVSTDGSFLMEPHRIEAFLKLSHWIRQQLLSIQTPNTKGSILLAPEALIPLPPWVDSEDVGIPLQPLEEKHYQLQALEREALLEDLRVDTP